MRGRGSRSNLAVAAQERHPRLLCQLGANELPRVVSEVKLIGESNHGSIAGIGNAMNEAMAKASTET